MQSDWKQTPARKKKKKKKKLPNNLWRKGNKEETRPVCLHSEGEVWGAAAVGSKLRSDVGVVGAVVVYHLLSGSGGPQAAPSSLSSLFLCSCSSSQPRHTGMWGRSHTQESGIRNTIENQSIKSYHDCSFKCGRVFCRFNAGYTKRALSVCSSCLWYYEQVPKLRKWRFRFWVFKIKHLIPHLFFCHLFCTRR